MRTYANRATHYRVASVVMMMFLTVLLGACGVKTVEIDISDQGLNLVENAAPSEDFAFYVSSNSVPQSAADLRKYGVLACTGDRVANRAIQIAMGLGISGISSGPADAECLAKATQRNTVMVTQRTNKPPSGVVEIVFK
jgi:hypothetical protein